MPIVTAIAKQFGKHVIYRIILIIPNIDITSQYLRLPPIINHNFQVGVRLHQTSPGLSLSFLLRSCLAFLIII
jgi:hypothetical protein